MCRSTHRNQKTQTRRYRVSALTSILLSALCGVAQTTNLWSPKLIGVAVLIEVD